MNRGIFRGNLDEEQCAIFAQILEGKTGREIATRLGTTPSRVENIVKKTRRQLDASSRHDAARVIACHFGWKTSPVVPFVGGDNGKDGHRFAAKMAQTEREHSASSGYIRDAGNQSLSRGNDAGTYSEIARGFNISEFLAASPKMQRVLLMVVLIVGSTFALSALVSTMQGLDVLMFS